MSTNAQHCRHAWLARQGLPTNGVEPCGDCGPCQHYGIETLDAATVAGQVRAALGDGDRNKADRLLRHAVHLGVEPLDLFLAGGDNPKPAAARSSARRSDKD